MTAKGGSSFFDVLKNLLTSSHLLFFNQKTTIMSNELIKKEGELIQRLVLDGDISRMSQEQKVLYYNQFCNSLGINPLTQPFQIIKFQGKEIS